MKTLFLSYESYFKYIIFIKIKSEFKQFPSLLDLVRSFSDCSVLLESNYKKKLKIPKIALTKKYEGVI
jgi:hypothetical protein